MSHDARATVALATLTTVVAIAAPGCQGGGGGAGTAPAPPPTALTAPDAGVGSVDGGITTLPTYDPRDGFFLDPDPGAPRTPGRNARRDRPPVSLLLRSTPVGAIAAVDGIRLGTTPVLWDGDGGIPHEFTFVLSGHALARYRFVPIVSGVVHGTLVRITNDATTPEIPQPITPPAPRQPPPQPPQPPPAPPIDAAPPTEATDAAVAPAIVPVGPTP